METTVLLDTDDLVDSPPNKVEPRDGSRERETRDDGVQGLSLKLLGQNLDSFESGVRHFII